MTVLITLTLAGIDTDSFLLYSDVDGYISAFASDVSRVDLLAGYACSTVPDGTTIIRVLSTGTCTNYVDLIVDTSITTTTTTSTLNPGISTTTTTSTTAAPPTTTTTTTLAGITASFTGRYATGDPAHPLGGYITYIDVYGVSQTITDLWIGDCETITYASIVLLVGVTSPCTI